MTDKVEKIREEVEKLKSLLLRGACSSQIAMETRCKDEAYDEVLAILDTMQKETVSDDLEYASEKYACKFSSSKYGHDKVKSAFIAGADWQRHYEAKYREDNNICCMPFDDIDAARVAAYEQGKRDMKEQLMEGSIECYVRRNKYTKKNVLNGFDVTCDAVQQFNGGDKVKVIVIKEN